jgi:hypothetical protein
MAHRQWLGWWVFIAVIVIIFLGDRVINGRRGESYHRQLVDEFSAITPLPNASLVETVDNFSKWNPHKALVGASYSTSTPLADIREFYNQKLESRGWHLAEDRSLTDGGKDFGGREIRYCKGAMAASIQYGGAESHYGWTYALDLTWGLHSCN